MKKNRLIALGAAAVLSATAVVGGTLAYFTDTDAETNTFVLGNVKIDLHEANKNGDKDDAYLAWLENQKLVPTTQAQKENTIDKIVTIENTGSVDAYVWAEVWIPAALDNEDASKNSLHFNFDGSTVSFKVTDPATKEIDGVDYNGYILYEKGENSVVAAGETSGSLMTQVYMDAKVSQNFDADGNVDGYVLADGETVYTGDWNLIVNGIGIQADSFADIDEAMKAYYDTTATEAETETDGQ